MKNLRTTLFLTLIVLFAKTTFSQSKFAETLAGRWTVMCIPQKNTNGSINMSDLCPFFIDSKNQSKAEVKSFEITFEKDKLTLNRDNKITTTNYSDNKDDSFTFTFDNKTYSFKVYLDDERIILYESRGAMLVLEKTK